MILTEQLQDIQTKLYVERSNPNRDVQMIHDLEYQEANLLEQLSNSEHQERIQQATTEFSSILDNLSLDGMSMRELIGDEDIYQAVNILVKQAFDAQVTVFSNTNKDIQTNSAKQIAAVTAELNQAKEDKANAEADLQASQIEIDKLNAENSELKTKLASMPTAPTYSPEEQSQQIKDLADKIRQSKVKIYDKMALDISGSNFSAKLATTGETFTFKHLYEKSYVVITEEEALQLQQEEKAKQEPVITPLQPITIDTGNQFHDEVQLVISTLSNDREAQTETVTREEYEALKNQVSALSADVQTLKERQLVAA